MTIKRDLPQHQPKIAKVQKLVNVSSRSRLCMRKLPTGTAPKFLTREKLIRPTVSRSEMLPFTIVQK